MISLLLLLTVHASALATYALPQSPQVVFKDDSESPGLLRRFTFNGPDGLATMMKLAQAHDLDVWQMTPTHADIYSSASSVLPASLLAFATPSNTSSIDASAHKKHKKRKHHRGKKHKHHDPPYLRSLQNSTFHDEYHPLFEIDAFVEDLAHAYPKLVTAVELGHSAEGREMFAIRIAKSGSAAAQKKKGKKKGEKEKPVEKHGFVLMGAQHAREWVATAAALYTAHALVADAAEPNSMYHLLDHFDFYIIPTPNPDGYVYTWDTDRFWYKNRMPLGPEERCQGLDMNRNWGFKWSPSTPSDSAPAADPCSHWYPGHRPFQAPEVNNIANYVLNAPRLKAFLDLRSYGQMLSSPFSYTCDVLPADAEDQFEAMFGVAHVLKKKHATSFTTGGLCSMLYSAPGNILDWMYGVAGIKYAYAAHLRDTGTYGYALPEEWIRRAGEETTTMVEYLARFVTKIEKDPH